MSVGLYTLRKTYVDGDTLSASDYVADHQQHIDNQNPQETGALSDNVTQYQATTDTGDAGSESLASALDGELERLRFVVKDIKAKISGSVVAQWYAKTYALVVATANIAAGAVTVAKLAANATFLQFLRNTAANVTIGTSDTTLVFQAITLARTRCRITVVCHLHVADAGAISTDTIIVKLKRGASEVARATVFPAVATGDASAPTAVIQFVDNPGTGAVTYNVTGIRSTGSFTSAVNETAISIEEIV